MTALLLGFVIFLGLFAARMTGFVVEGSVEHEDRVERTLLGTEEFVWTPAHPCTDKECVLSSVSISGTLRANASGSVRVELVAGDPITIVEKNIELEALPVENEVTEAEQQGAEESANESGLETTPEKIETTIVFEPQTMTLDHACEDSCSITQHGTESYTVRVDLGEQMTLVIDTIHYQWHIPESEEEPIVANATEKRNTTLTEDNLTETNMTVNVSKEVVLNATLNESVLEALSTDALDFAAREGNPNLPRDWFLKPEIDAYDNDSAAWEWAPLTVEGMLLDFAAMRRPQEWYSGQQLRVYSRTITFNSSQALDISLRYHGKFEGECMQLGAELAGADDSSKTTLFLTLTHEGVVLPTADFNASSQQSGEIVEVHATSVPGILQNATRGKFFFVPLCDHGSVELRNITYTFIN